MTPTFLEKPGFTIIGVSQNVTLSTLEAVPDLWLTFKDRMSEITPIADTAYGVSIHDLEEDGRFDYVAAFATDPDATPPSGMVKHEIPAARYAMFEHLADTEGDVQSGMKKTMSYIFGAWLPKSGYTLAKSPDFEEYGPDFNPGTLTGTIRIFVPVLEN